MVLDFKDECNRCMSIQFLGETAKADIRAGFGDIVDRDYDVELSVMSSFCCGR